MLDAGQVEISGFGRLHSSSVELGYTHNLQGSTHLPSPTNRAWLYSIKVPLYIYSTTSLASQARIITIHCIQSIIQFSPHVPTHLPLFLWLLPCGNREVEKTIKSQYIYHKIISHINVPTPHLCLHLSDARTPNQCFWNVPLQSLPHITPSSSPSFAIPSTRPSLLIIHAHPTLHPLSPLPLLPPPLKSSLLLLPPCLTASKSLIANNNPSSSSNVLTGRLEKLYRPLVRPDRCPSLPVPALCRLPLSTRLFDALAPCVGGGVVLSPLPRPRCGRRGMPRREKGTPLGSVWRELEEERWRSRDVLARERGGPNVGRLSTLGLSTAQSESGA